MQGVIATPKAHCLFRLYLLRRVWCGSIAYHVVASGG